MATSFRYDKETLYKEFNNAKQKDIALSKKKLLSDKENDIHVNRIALLKEYIDLQKSEPDVFEFVDMNFQKLLEVYETPDPRNTFYKSVFGVSYEAKQAESQVKSMADYSRSETVNNVKDEVLEL